MLFPKVVIISYSMFHWTDKIKYAAKLYTKDILLFDTYICFLIHYVLTKIKKVLFPKSLKTKNFVCNYYITGQRLAKVTMFSNTVHG